MAFNPAPTSIWPSYSSDGTNITIPIAALNGLTSAEAHATTGSWLAIMQSLMVTQWEYYNSLATAAKPTAYVPAKPTQVFQNVGAWADYQKVTFMIDMYLNIGTLAAATIAPEPA